MYHLKTKLEHLQSLASAEGTGTGPGGSQGVTASHAFVSSTSFSRGVSWLLPFTKAPVCSGLDTLKDSPALPVV